jgi:hypothetical protein
MIIWSVLEHFRNLSKVKWCKTCVSGLNALFFGTQVTKIVSYQKHPFYSNGPKIIDSVLEHFGNLQNETRCKAPKMMFGTFLELFANLRNVKRCETCVSDINALFRGNEVAMHSLYSIRPKMMFGGVSEHFANLQHNKRCNTCVSCLNALFGVPKLQMWFRNQRIHSTLFDPKWLFGVFWSISETIGK